MAGWTLATGAGGYVAGRVGDWLVRTGSAVSQQVGLASIALAGGLAVGVLQSLVLSRGLRRAYLWGLASLVGGIVGATIGFIYNDVFASLFIGVGTASALQVYLLQRVWNIANASVYLAAVSVGTFIGLIPSCMIGYAAGKGGSGGAVETYTTGGIIVGLFTGLGLLMLLRSDKVD